MQRSDRVVLAHVEELLGRDTYRRRIRRGRMGAVKHLIVVVAVAVVAVGAACAPDGANVPELDPAAERGRVVALENGCAVCHGQYGQGGAAGSFFGLWGSTVELSDGTTVVADADYLRRAIVDPSVEIVAGSDLEMPAVALTDDQVDAMLTWIEALADE